MQAGGTLVDWLVNPPTGFDRGAATNRQRPLGIGAMLFAVTFVLNIVGDLAIQRLQKKLTAE